MKTESYGAGAEHSFLKKWRTESYGVRWRKSEIHSFLTIKMQKTIALA